MSSYDWKASESRFGSPNNIPEIYRELISRSESADSRYLPSTKTEITWVIDRVLRAERALDENRLYISKAHRDLFRDYLALAKAFADTSFEDDETRDQLFALRNRIEGIVRPMLRKANGGR